jgi:small neutral amino acid transporter SnatA (MarC family)
MTVWAVVLAFAASTNAFRRRTALSVPRDRDVVAGAGAALATYVLLAVLGTTLRDTLDVSAPNARIAAGLVLIVTGLHAAVTAVPAPMPIEYGPRAWLSPAWFPVLLRPDLALVALAADNAGSVVAVVVGATLALAKTAAWWRHRGGSSAAPTRVERALSAFVGVALVVAAVRLLLDGVLGI